MIKVFYDHVEINGKSYKFWDIPDEIYNNLSEFVQLNIEEQMTEYLYSQELSLG